MLISHSKPGKTEAILIQKPWVDHGKATHGKVHFAWEGLYFGYPTNSIGLQPQNAGWQVGNLKTMEETSSATSRKHWLLSVWGLL